MPRELIFTGQRELEIRNADRPDLGSDQIRARALCSLMSTGTENIVYNRLFDPGTHWDNWVKYPFQPGYSWIGEVTEVGSAVEGYQPGQRIAARMPHADETVIDDFSSCIPIPDGLSTDEAAWFALAKIAYTGVAQGQVKLGSQVLIIGGGPIGQMALRWSRACGAHRCVLVDPLPLRQDMARQGGAHDVIGERIDAVIEQMPNYFDGELPDLVIDTTGVAAVFESAIECCRHQGTVVVLGDTGSPVSQHLTSRVIVHGIHIVGAHDGLYDTAPPVRLFFDLARDGRFNVTDMITHRFAFEDAASAYELANTDRASTMGILFEY